LLSLEAYIGERTSGPIFLNDKPFRDVQDFAGHADPRTTRRYDRCRNNLDRHATYALAARLGRGPGPQEESRSADGMTA